MQLRIDVTDSAGARYGSGPITSATRWQSVARLDRAGTFFFEMPASDPQAALVTPHAYVYGYGLVNGAMTQLGAGIVDQIDVVGGTPTMLRVSGDDLLRELSWRLTGSQALGPLLLSETGYVSAEDVHFLHFDTASGNYIDGYNTYANTFDGNLATYDAIPSAPIGGPGHTIDSHHLLYVGYSLPYSRVKFTLKTINPNPNCVWDKVQYYASGVGWRNAAGFNDGVVEARPGVAGWLDLPAYADGTAVAGSTWKQTGNFVLEDISTDEGYPFDWTPYEQDTTPAAAAPTNRTDYWLRFRGDDVNPPSAEIYEIQVYTRVPTTNAPQLCLDSGPAGWTLDAVLGFATTSQAIQAISNDETILAALIRVGALTFEHFRLGVGRKLVWLRKTTPSSGIRAMRVTDPLAIEGNPTVCALTHLTKQTASGVLATRIRPFGAGQGTARLTLNDTTRATDGVNPVPAGYTLDASNNWLINDDAEALYGRIDSTQTWSNIGPPTTALADRAPAANGLYDVALSWLQLNSAPPVTYSGAVAGLSTVLLPGQTVRVVWKEVVDGYVALDLDADLIVLEATVDVDSQGVQTTALKVSAQAYWPKTEAEVLAEAVGRLQQHSSYPQRSDVGMLHTPTSGSAPSGGTLILNGQGGVYPR